MEDLNKLFLEELADVYSAEKQLLKALPKMAKAATSEELRTAFETHLDETEEQVNRLEQVFELFGKPAKAKKCEAMEGLIEEGKGVMSDHDESPVLDAALICAAQKIEHYEIATYGTLCTWAELMGNDEALELLKETLGEEKETDEKLSEIAETAINVQAAQGSEGEEEDGGPTGRSSGGSKRSRSDMAEKE